LNALQSCPVSSESSEGDGKDSKEDDDEKDLSTVSTSSIPSSHSTSSLSTWKSFPISCAVGDETAEEEAYEELCYITFNVKEVRPPLSFARSSFLFAVEISYIFCSVSVGVVQIFQHVLCS
jgi:hypothetical protein